MSETAATHAQGELSAPESAPERRRQEAQRAVRERVWPAFARVARPDARFHWDFTAFIADFAGSDLCVERVRELTSYTESRLLFITPDNSLEDMRRAAMQDGKPFLMTTHGIARGFLLLDPDRVPPEQRRHAATLDGIERYARPVTLAQIRAAGPVDLLITGASAVTLDGVRLGKGHGYFDLEWAMLSELGVVRATSEVVAVCHDCQVLDEHVPASDLDSVVDWVATPTRSIHVAHPPRAPGRVDWEALSPALLQSIPVLTELRELLGGPRSAQA